MGCIGGLYGAAEGVGDLVRVDGIMTAQRYKQILIHHAVPSGRRLIGENFIFQHDNDPKHTADIIKRYLGRKEEQGALQLMQWPPQSPDLNIIEQVWDHLDREKVQKQPKSVEELWKVLKNAWNTIPADVFQRLQNSIPKRIQSVLKNKGGHTKY